MSPATRRSASARWRRCATSSSRRRRRRRSSRARRRRPRPCRGRSIPGCRSLRRPSSSTPHGPSCPGMATASSVNRPGRTVDVTRRRVRRSRPPSGWPSAAPEPWARSRAPGPRCRIRAAAPAGDGRRRSGRARGPAVAVAKLPDRDQRAVVARGFPGRGAASSSSRSPPRPGGGRASSRARSRRWRSRRADRRPPGSRLTRSPAIGAAGPRALAPRRPPPVPRGRPGYRAPIARPRPGTAGGRPAGSAGRRAD